MSSHPESKRAMGFDVIERAGSKHVKRSERDTRFSTHDIPRAQPGYPWKQFTNKPDLSLLGEIKGSKPVPLYSQLRREIDFSLRTDDIEYCQPRGYFVQSRKTSPLDPEYKLPSCIPCEPYIVKYSGAPSSTLYCDDIEASRPRQLIPSVARLPKEHVALSTSNTRGRQRPAGAEYPDSLIVNDILAGPFHKAVIRNTNPLEPVYKLEQSKLKTIYHAWDNDVAVEPLKSVVCGPIEKSSPTEFPYWRNSKPARDNKEAVPGSNSQRFVANRPFNMYSSDRKPNVSENITDIPGAQADTLRRGLRTNRCTDPLEPQY